jgi:hypothetical protein
MPPVSWHCILTRSSPPSEADQHHSSASSPLVALCGSVYSSGLFLVISFFQPVHRHRSTPRDCVRTAESARNRLEQHPSHHLYPSPFHTLALLDPSGRIEFPVSSHRSHAVTLHTTSGIPCHGRPITRTSHPHFNIHLALLQNGACFSNSLSKVGKESRRRSRIQ